VRNKKEIMLYEDKIVNQLFNQDEEEESWAEEEPEEEEEEEIE